MDTEQRLRDLAISDSGFIFDPYSGATFSVNPTGVEIVEGLREGLEREALVERLQETFEVADLDDPERDLDEFVGMLRQYGIVDKHFEL
ncbi:MAG: PqqD family protein [Myxococcota bacterium]